MASRGDRKCREMAEWSAAPCNHSTLSQRYWLFGLFREENNVMQNRERSGAFALPKTSAPSSGAGCYGDHLHGHARSSSDRAGSHGTVGTDTGNPSCSRSGNRNIPPDGRLSREKQQQGGFSVRDVFAYRVMNKNHCVQLVLKGIIRDTSAFKCLKKNNVINILLNCGSILSKMFLTILKSLEILLFKLTLCFTGL